MCGRYASDVAIDDLTGTFHAIGVGTTNWSGSYSIAPTDPAPIVREWRRDDVATREVDLASWGLRPAWAKNARVAPINARIETVAQKPLFRSAFGSRRALVPMRGYYEWEQVGDVKQPHFIHADSLLAAAGLYAGTKNETGGWDHSFTIITTAARDSSGTLHDRMPAFVTADLWDEWLSPQPLEDDGTGLLAALDRSSVDVAATITTYPVSRQVNSVAKVDPSDETLIEPLA